MMRAQFLISCFLLALCLSNVNSIRYKIGRNVAYAPDSYEARLPAVQIIVNSLQPKRKPTRIQLPEFELEKELIEQNSQEDSCEDDNINKLYIVPSTESPCDENDIEDAELRLPVDEVPPVRHSNDFFWIFNPIPPSTEPPRQETPATQTTPELRALTEHIPTFSRSTIATTTRAPLLMGCRIDCP